MITLKAYKHALLKLFITAALISFISACALSPEPSIDKLISTLNNAEKQYQNNNLDSARTLYTKVLEIDQYQPSVYYKLGNIAFKQNKLMEAQSWYIKCLQLKPNYIKAHYNLSIVYLLLAKPHIDYFNGNASKNQIDEPLSEISALIESFSEKQKTETFEK